MAAEIISGGMSLKGFSSPGLGVTALLAALLVAGAFLWVSAAAPNRASEPDQSFQQLFMWG